MPLFLLHRLLVGIIVGTTYSHDPVACRWQIMWLIATYLLLLAYIALERPFLVPMANLFEFLVVVTQMSCVGLNLWPVNVSQSIFTHWGSRVGGHIPLQNLSSSDQISAPLY